MKKRKLGLTLVAYLTVIIVILLLIIFFFYNYFLLPNQNKSFNELYIANNAASFASAVNKAAPSVVSIQTSKGTNAQRGLGSGVIVDEKGHILTNNHVISDTQSILVKLSDGRSSNAQLIGADPQTDIAVLQIAMTDIPVITMGNSSKIRVGDIVLAIGNPFGLTSTVTQGIISAIGSIQSLINSNQEFSEIADNLIQTDAAINVGNSGGALIDTRGNLIGINTAIISTLVNSQGIGFAIPIDTTKQIMHQLIAKGTIARSWIGAQLSSIPDETRKLLNYQNPNGIYVQDTIRNSPAQKAGILPGDIIVKIDNIEVQDMSATLRLISNLHPNKTYQLEVFRQGKSLIYPVTVAIRP